MNAVRRWLLLMPLVLTVGCGTLPEPTPTPKPRETQVAQLTQVAALSTATAGARALATLNAPTATATVPTNLVGSTGAPVTGPAPTATLRQLVPLASGQTYRDTNNRFSILLPQGWMLGPGNFTNPNQQLVGKFLAPVPAGSVEVSLTVSQNKSPYVEDVSINEVGDAMIYVLRDQLTNYQLYSLDKVLLGAHPARRHIFRFKQGKEEMSGMQFYLIKGDKLHVLTFMTTTGRWATDEALFMSIAATYIPLP